MGNQTRDNAALIIDGVDLLMNETVGVVLDLVLQKVCVCVCLGIGDVLFLCCCCR